MTASLGFVHALTEESVVCERREQGYHSPSHLPSDHVPIPGGPSEGMRVIIYMPDELEMEATLELDPTSKCWIARPDIGTIKYTPPKSK